MEDKLTANGCQTLFRVPSSIIGASFEANQTMWTLIVFEFQNLRV